MLRQLFSRRLLVVGIVSFGIGLVYNHIEMRRYRSTGAVGSRIYTDEQLNSVCPYAFDENGVLRHQETGEKFQWTTKEDYERVALYVSAYVAEQLRVRGFQQREPDGLFILNRPTGVEEEDEDEDLETSTPQHAIIQPRVAPRILVLVPGSGPVLAGLWSRKLSINDNLSTGSMLPVIDRALSDPRYSEIYVLNPNNNLQSGGSENQNKHTDHVVEVWTRYLRNKSNVILFAHSYGGVACLDLLQRFPETVMEGVTRMVFTDSVHWLPRYFAHVRLSDRQKSWFRTHSRNWISSTKIVGQKVGLKGGCESVSAGTDEHDLTTSRATDSVFEYLDTDEVKKEEML